MQQSIRIFEDEAEVVYGVVQSLPPPLCAAYDGRLAAERRVVLGPVWGPWAVTGRSRPPPGWWPCLQRDGLGAYPNAALASTGNGHLREG